METELYETELYYDMVNYPYDVYPNSEATEDDISERLLFEYLRKTNNKLFEQIGKIGVMEILDNLQLLTTVYGHKYIQNVALMMFCEHTDRFFPQTWAEIKTFPERSRRIKRVVVKGSVPAMISGAMGWIRENVIREKDAETDSQIETTSTVNYPDEAVEEAIVNAFCHRDYRSGKPVSIEIEPDRIRVVSFSGIDRVISYKADEEGVRFVPKYARNRRLGEFLKELNLARGVGVGVPIIQQVLRDNGSPRAVFKTDDNRKAMSVEIPIHPDFLSQNKVSKKVVSDTINETINEKPDSFDTINVNPSSDDNHLRKVELSGYETTILSLISDNRKITRKMLAKEAKCVESTVSRAIRHLEDMEIIKRVGSRKTGYWEIII